MEIKCYNKYMSERKAMLKRVFGKTEVKPREIKAGEPVKPKCEHSDK